MYDKSDPYNDGAKPNSWTPALNETWTWGKDRAYGLVGILSVACCVSDV